MHHDFAFVTDWTGPRGRVGRMRFRMHNSVFPGDHMVFSASVTGTEIDATEQGWVTLEIRLTTESGPCTSCTARVALPADPDDNPWDRRADRWIP